MAFEADPYRIGQANLQPRPDARAKPTLQNPFTTGRLFNRRLRKSCGMPPETPTGAAGPRRFCGRWGRATGRNVRPWSVGPSDSRGCNQCDCRDATNEGRATRTTLPGSRDETLSPRGTRGRRSSGKTCRRERERWRVSSKLPWLRDVADLRGTSPNALLSERVPW